MARLSVHLLQPFPDKYSAFQSTYRMLTAPEEHLAARDIVYAHTHRYTHGMDSVEQSCNDPRLSARRWSHLKACCHSIRVSGFEPSIGPKVKVQPCEGQGKEGN